MDQTKEQIQEYFNVFDKDGSGFIDKEEIKDLAKNVGLDWNDHKLEKIISALDTNGDGKISFEEFYEYFLYGEQKEMDELMEMKFQHIKSVKTLQKQISQDYAHILQKNKEEGKQQYSVSLNIGDKSNLQYVVEFALRIGEENTNFTESLLKHFEQIDNNTIQIVIRYQCYNPEVLKGKLQELFETLVEIGLNMMPLQLSQQLANLKDDLKIDYATLPDELLIRIYLDNEIIDKLVLVYRQLSGIQTENLQKIFRQLETVEKFQNTDPEFLKNLGRGLQANFDVTTSSDLVKLFYLSLQVEYARQIYSTLLAKYHGTYKVKFLEHLTPFTMINNARLQFNFETFQDLVEEIGSPFLNYLNQQLAISSNQNNNNNEFSQILNQTPIANDFLNLLKSEKKGPVDLVLISKEASITMTDASNVV
ncbi:unnamed protein product (macronuclear) [Paramecium tetraurelia]|uniref:EF-hand domain-containing protein n=1 Tax=Paramecium tetraurelia TaxID=5888 RepID=A0E9C3_PARTE|nr:uncharacterized protein GSPATT00024621001 [Paramecium tetraurelia]CAK91890.1 unnamed protein product [Paramecium tetraurelia]|eukprot:XP_001459287.1 hypothetical protein (macronuclear) [Paramecium tetraurelia strain d4-2]